MSSYFGGGWDSSLHLSEFRAHSLNLLHYTAMCCSHPKHILFYDLLPSLLHFIKGVASVQSYWEGGDKGTFPGSNQSETLHLEQRPFVLGISCYTSLTASPTNRQHLLSRSCNLDLTGAGMWQTGEEQRRRASCSWTRVRSERRARDRMVIRMGTPRTWGV